jgi:carbohydrate binding protein with CBM4/9 domain
MRIEKMALMISMGLLAAAGVQRAGAQAAGENLFKNPGFESNQDWWQFDQSFGTATGTIAFDDPMAVHEGAKGAKIQVTAIDAENWHIQLQCPPQFVAVKDAEYTLTFWGRTPSAEGKSVHVAIQDGAPDYGYRAGQDYGLDTTWQKIEKVWTSDVEGLEMLRFNIYLGKDTGTYYFDDFSLTAASAPIGLRNPKRSVGMPLRNAVTIPAVDAAGRSVGIGKTRARAGIAFSP